MQGFEKAMPIIASMAKSAPTAIARAGE